MSAITIHIGPILREARRTRRWSQEQLAGVADLDRSFVGEIERGLVSPSLTTLEKLALALGVPASELISRSELRSRTVEQKNAGDSP